MIVSPLAVLGVCFVGLWLAAQMGSYFRRKRQAMDQNEQGDLGVVVTASLTLLGLVIGFTFSMAVTRYDLRKTYEEAEANAIGTEYLRAGLLSASDAMRI